MGFVISSVDCKSHRGSLWGGGAQLDVKDAISALYLRQGVEIGSRGG